MLIFLPLNVLKWQQRKEITLKLTGARVESLELRPSQFSLVSAAIYKKNRSVFETYIVIIRIDVPTSFGLNLDDSNVIMANNEDILKKNILNWT